MNRFEITVVDREADRSDEDIRGHATGCQCQGCGCECDSCAGDAVACQSGAPRSGLERALEDATGSPPEISPLSS